MLTYGIPPDFRGGVPLFIETAMRHQVRPEFHQVTQLHTDGVHRQEFAGTGQKALKVVPVTGAAFASPWTNQCTPLFFPHSLVV